MFRAAVFLLSEWTSPASVDTQLPVKGGQLIVVRAEMIFVVDVTLKCR